MKQQITSPAVKGVIISLLLIVFGLVIYFTDQLANQPLGYVQYIILIGGIIWACINYSKQMNGDVTFGNVFGHGFKTTAAVTAIMCVYSFLALKFIFPDMEDKIMEIARDNMRGKNMTEEQIKQGMDFMSKSFVLFAIIGILFMFAIVGAISSLIGAAVAKKKPKDPFGQPQM